MRYLQLFFLTLPLLSTSQVLQEITSKFDGELHQVDTEIVLDPPYTLHLDGVPYFASLEERVHRKVWLFQLKSMQGRESWLLMDRNLNRSYLGRRNKVIARYD